MNNALQRTSEKGGKPMKKTLVLIGIVLFLFLCGGILLIFPKSLSDVPGACLVVGVALMHLLRWKKVRAKDKLIS